MLKESSEIIVECRSKAEAHIYIAVAKSDKNFSEEERRKILYCASNARVFAGNSDIEEGVKARIQSDIKDIYGKANFNNLSADDHLNEALRLLKKSKEFSGWGVKLLYEKMEEGLQAIAELDQYIVKESRFIRKIRDKLRNDFK